MPKSARTKTPHPGKLLLIGGAEEKAGEDLCILRRVAELAGGSKARLLVCAAASREPQEVLAIYEQTFTGIGVADVITAPMQDRPEAEDPHWIEVLDGVTGLFLTGGDQMKLTSILAGTPFWDRVRQRHEEGLLVAGTSAGAAAMSSTMIAGGRGATVKRSGVHLAPGLGFLHETVIDMHFNRSGRVHRMMSMLAQNPAHIGVGLDEDTAIELSDGQFYVIGSGVAMVFDGHMQHTNAAIVGNREALALAGVAVHVLPEGYGFDLKSRTVIVPEHVQVHGESGERSVHR